MTDTRPTSAHFNLILSPKSPVPDDTFRPTKKRRYSDSPVLPISSAGRERISPIRDNSTAGFSNQHIDPLVVAIPPRSPTPASANEQKPTAAAEIVIPEEKKRVSVNAGESLRVGQGLLKPIARRPSPGSQLGKAKAARKSEETDMSLGPSLSSKAQQHTAEELQTPDEDNKRSRTRPATATQTVGEGPNPRVKAKEISRRPRQSTTPPPAQDAHEWFLEHYDDPLPLSDEPAASPPSPILSPSQKQMSTPATMPEAAVALEQELEDLVVNSPTIPSKLEPEADVDMDVDLAVTELVAETYSVPHIDVGMEVDVEDELLSLLDDRPSGPRRTSGATTCGSTSSSSTRHPLFQAAATGGSDARQDSPSVVSLSGNVSPAIRSLSARPMSERESMPPPASVAPSRGQDKSEKTEQASSATAPTTKKKKDVASKVCPDCALYFLLLR
jgi:COMPASS component SPP1